MQSGQKGAVSSRSLYLNPSCKRDNSKTMIASKRGAIMQDKLIHDLEALMVAGVEHHLVGKNAIGRVHTLVNELKESRSLGMPAFTIAPTPGFCSACGQSIPAHKKTGETKGDL